MLPTRRGVCNFLFRSGFDNRPGVAGVGRGIEIPEAGVFSIKESICNASLEAANLVL